MSLKGRPIMTADRFFAVASRWILCRFAQMAVNGVDVCGGEVDFCFCFLENSGFPDMGVPPNHPFQIGIFH